MCRRVAKDLAAGTRRREAGGGSGEADQAGGGAGEEAGAEGRRSSWWWWSTPAGALAGRRGAREEAAALIVDEGDGEVRWRGTKGGEEEVVRGGLEVEAARGSGTGTRGSSPLAALEGSRGESERRWGLGLDRHRLGLGS